MITPPPIADPGLIIRRAYSSEPADRLLPILSALLLFLLVACVAVWAAQRSSVITSAPVVLEPLPPLPAPSPCRWEIQTHPMADYVVEDSHGSHLENAPTNAWGP